MENYANLFKWATPSTTITCAWHGWIRKGDIITIMGSGSEYKVIAVNGNTITVERHKRYPGDAGAIAVGIAVILIEAYKIAFWWLH